MTRLARLARLVLAAVLAASLASQTPPVQDPHARDHRGYRDYGGTRQRLRDLQSQLAQLDGQVAQLRKRRSGVLVELQATALKAAAARATAEMARLSLGDAQREVAGLGRRMGEIQAELGRLRGALRRYARWLQALGPLGTLGFLPASADAGAYMARSRYMDWWARNEARKLQRVRDLYAELAEREREIVDAEARFSKAEAEAGALRRELEAGERRLQEHLHGILRDERLKRQLQEELKEEAVMLERLLASVVSGPDVEARFQAAVPFRELAGRLRSPVEGTLAEAFGVQTHPRFGTRTMNTGLLVAAEGGAPVRAVADAKVAMADSYQSYGLMAILDHGGAYYSIYTYMRSLSVRQGQAVRGGDTIGHVGDTPEGPRLGFEIRRQTTPEDPQRWLASRYVAKR